MSCWKSVGTWITAFCTVVCCLHSFGEVQAQQIGGLNSQFGSNPSAPRLFRPRARAISGRYVPRHMRATATQEVIADEAVIGSGSAGDQPIATVVDDVVAQSMGDCADCASGGYAIGGPVDQVISGGSCGCGSCGDCYAGDFCGCGEIDCRDCGIAEDCWMRGLGGLFYNGEYFFGVQAFTGQGLRDRQNAEPCSAGYHLGFNWGLPLYRITCGLVSGQFGVRTVQSNLEGDLFSPARRDQTFITAGLFRRVDYGVQFGVVADILNEEWIAQVDLVQVRSELSYVWPAGHAFGFRAANGVQDDRNVAVVGGAQIPGVGVQAIDTYRFFLRNAHFCGGHGEWFAGWSGERHAVIGADFDVPLGDCWGLQTGFTYLIPESNGQPLIENEGWNIYLGWSYRPRGRGWYQFYHRPLLPVADNGSMVIRRF